MFAQDFLPEGYVSRMGPQIGSATRLLGPNEFLFRTGEAKTCFYRVNSGAVCLYEQNRPEHPVVDFAFPGDFVGFGFLQTHTCCARAVTSTEVACLPLDEVASAIADDPRRDPTVIGECCPSVFAAGYLGLSIEELTALLLELERRKLIEAYSGGVRLKDIGALEKLASQTVAPLCKSKSKNHANNCTQGVSLGGGQNA